MSEFSVFRNTTIVPGTVECNEDGIITIYSEDCSNYLQYCSGEWRDNYYISQQYHIQIPDDWKMIYILEYQNKTEYGDYTYKLVEHILKIANGNIRITKFPQSEIIVVEEYDSHSMVLPIRTTIYYDFGLKNQVITHDNEQTHILSYDRYGNFDYDCHNLTDEDKKEHQRKLEIVRSDIDEIKKDDLGIRIVFDMHDLVEDNPKQAKKDKLDFITIRKKQIYNAWRNVPDMVFSLDSISLQYIAYGELV